MKIKEIVFSGALGLALALSAATPTITSVTAQQQHPYNGLVDITVTLAGESNEVAQTHCRFIATNSATQVALSVENITQVGGDSDNGGIWTRHFVWNASTDVGEVKIDNVILSVVAETGVQLWQNGPYWAECNVGATKPEEYGYYFWWGDTVGYTKSGGRYDSGVPQYTNVTWVSSMGVQMGDSPFTSTTCPTYNKSNSQLQSAGYIDSTGNLVAGNDAATTHLGVPWRLPTDSEFLALSNNCTSTWTTRNGVYGRLVKGKGNYATKSIFLPAAGLCWNFAFQYFGKYGRYWSSSPSSNPSNACAICFSSSKFYCDGITRIDGRSVRALRDLDSFAVVTTHLSLDCTRVQVTDVVAQQRYPWNGLVDITVTLTGTSNDVSKTQCRFAATNSTTQVALSVEDITRVGDDLGSGSMWIRHFVWNAAADVGEVKIDDVALSVVAEIQQGGVQLWENGSYWADCNVGAAKPEEYGYYFWWGDTVGYTRKGGILKDDGNYSSVTWVSSRNVQMSSSPFLSSSCPTINKNNSQLRSAGFIDSTGNLVAAYDAATAHLGAPWRMPTDTDFAALTNYCTSSWTNCDGVYGLLVKGKGNYVSNSIFLPAAGYGNGPGLGYSGVYGCYWSSTPFSDQPECSWYLYFDSADFTRHYYGRNYGRPIRPLREFIVSHAEVSHLSLDCRTGSRIADLTENIIFSPIWEMTDGDALAKVFIDGVEMTNATKSGVLEWTPTKDGTYQFTHIVTVNGTPVGETLSATFTVVGVAPLAPVITPESGRMFESSLSISMSCPSEGATIHYTTDGSEPTLDSPVYGRFKISAKTTVKARAFYANGAGGDTTVAEYALGQCPDPVVVSAGGTTFAHRDNVVRIDWTCADGVVRYTTDGSDVTAESPVYVEPFEIDESMVVKAKAFGVTYFDSQQVTANLVREWETVATPVITAAAKFTGSETKVELVCTTPGATIRYTTNGNEPNSHATKYTGPFWVRESCAIKAYAVCDDYLSSDITTFDIVKKWGIGDTMGVPDHTFATSGDAEFFRVKDATVPAGEAMHSGAIGHSSQEGTYNRSVLSTTVMGPGTLAFSWRTSCEQDDEFEWDHAECAVDGVVVERLNDVTAWQNVSCEIAGAGPHTVTWTYLKDDQESQGEDCLWVAGYSWTPAEPWTHESDAPVPYSWIRGQFPHTVDEYVAYEAVAQDAAANGRKVWECYVAGIDATDPVAALLASVELVEDKVCISWTPNLNTGAVSRIYKVLGRTDLDKGDWETPVKPWHRFFKVSVSMPTGEAGEETAVSGEGFVPEVEAPKE